MPIIGHLIYRAILAKNIGFLLIMKVITNDKRAALIGVLLSRYAGYRRSDNGFSAYVIQV